MESELVLLELFRFLKGRVVFMKYFLSSLGVSILNLILNISYISWQIYPRQYVCASVSHLFDCLYCLQVATYRHRNLIGTSSEPDRNLAVT